MEANPQLSLLPEPPKVDPARQAENRATIRHAYTQIKAILEDKNPKLTDDERLTEIRELAREALEDIA